MGFGVSNIDGLRGGGGGLSSSVLLSAHGGRRVLRGHMLMSNGTVGMGDGVMSGGNELPTGRRLHQTHGHLEVFEPTRSRHKRRRKRIPTNIHDDSLAIAGPLIQ